MYQDWSDDPPAKPPDDEAQDDEVMVYNPSGLNLAIADHFADPDPDLPIAIGGRVMSGNMQPCPAHLDDSSPHGLLYVAVYVNRPELYVPVLKRKRLLKGTHTDPALGRALAMLQANPSADVNWMRTPTLWKAAHREYSRQLSMRKCIYYRAALEQSRISFFLEPNFVVGSWGVMSQVSRYMYTQTSRGKMLKALPDEPILVAGIPECIGQQVHDPIHKCHSAMLTWHSDVGLDNAKMQSLLASACDVESIEHLMQQLPCYPAAFKLFCDHIQKLVAVAGAKCYACCMEHCRHGQQWGRIHFHAYTGAAASFVRDSGITPPHLDIPLRMLNFHGYHAHARLSRLNGHSQACA
jgi:hypothetical protein